MITADKMATGEAATVNQAKVTSLRKIWMITPTKTAAFEITETSAWFNVF